MKRRYLGELVARVLETMADVAPRFLRELDGEKLRDVLRSDKPMTRIVVALERMRRGAVAELARRGELEGCGRVDCPACGKRKERGDAGPN